MKTSTLWMLALGLTLAIADLPADKPLSSGSFIKQAHAVVGRPLPPSCTVVVIEGTSLQKCGNTYYQASGTQYVVVNVQ